MHIDLPSGSSRLVIYSTLIEGEQTRQAVTVQRSVPYFSRDIDGWVDDAEVTISTSGGRSYTTLWVESEKAYLTEESFGTWPGVTYTLNVSYDFDGDGTPELYTASTTPKSPAYFDSVRVEPFTMPVTGNLNYRLSLYGTEPAGEDFYIIRIAVNDTVRNPRLENWTAMDDRLFDGGRLDGFPMGIYASAPDPFTSGDSLNMWLEPGDRVGVVVSRVDEDFFEFVREGQNSGGMTNPFFGGPPYNMRTNIVRDSGSGRNSSGGGSGSGSVGGGGVNVIGYFGSLYSSTTSATVPE